MLAGLEQEDARDIGGIPLPFGLNYVIQRRFDLPKEFLHAGSPRKTNNEKSFRQANEVAFLLLHKIIIQSSLA
jgi:hypothetical protein